MHGRELAGIVFGGAAGIVIAICILWYGFGADPLGVMAKYAPGDKSRVVAENEPPFKPPAEPPKPETKAPPMSPKPGGSVETSAARGPEPPASDSPAPNPPNPPPQPQNSLPPAPQPQGPVDPFARLPDHLSVAPVDGEHNLGPVDGRNGANWRVSLNSDLADLQGAYAFTIADSPTSSSSEGEADWLVELRPRSGAAPASFTSIGQGTVGRLFVEDDRLKFEWTGDLESAVRSQLLNASLSLSDGMYSREMWLRPAESQPAIALDLNRKLQVIPLNLVAPPPADNLILHVEDVQGFHSGVQIEPSPAKLRIGERMTAAISSGTPDLEAEFELQFAKTDAAPEIRLRAWYRLSDRREEFTYENASSDYAVLQRNLAKAQAELSAAQAAMRAIDNSIAALRRRTPASQAESVTMSRQAAALQAQRSKAASAIGRLSNTIPRTQATIQKMDALANLGRQLHQKANFRARLCAVAGSRELTLIHFNAPPQG
jgi:hypothetical protein